MTLLRYPVRALAGDYARATVGVMLCGGGALLAPPVSAAFWILAALAALFAGSAAWTALRHATAVVLDPGGVAAAGPRPARIDWPALDRVRLAYYSTRRDRSNGWMQLTLGAGRTRLRLDSALDDFPLVVAAASRAANMNGLALSAATRANIEALGQQAPGPRAPAALPGGGWGDPAEWRR
ncbi:MAG: hypothetical protein EXQ97_02705 [Alphaproteobacteria bacterium]|nr:hypothetical protein [Alphaproteobacteria bacterium]